MQVQGKDKVRQTILEIQKQHAQLHKIKKKMGDDEYNQKRNFVWNQLTNKEQLFKTAHIEKSPKFQRQHQLAARSHPGQNLTRLFYHVTTPGKTSVWKNEERRQYEGCERRN